MKNYKEIALEVNGKLEKENWIQFDKKQCWYSTAIEIDGDLYMIVKSYKTIVAIIDNTEELFVELGKWSSTTSKQCTQFHNKFCKSFDRKNLHLGLDEKWQEKEVA